MLSGLSAGASGALVSDNCDKFLQKQSASSTNVEANTSMYSASLITKEGNQSSVQAPQYNQIKSFLFGSAAQPTGGLSSHSLFSNYFPESNLVSEDINNY